MNPNDLITLVKNDAGLSFEEKEALIDKLREPAYVEKLKQGSAGAALGYLLGRFAKLSRESQILLSMAGFGIGNYLKTHEAGKPIKFNPKSRMYEIYGND